MKHNKFWEYVVMIAIVIGMIHGTVSSAYADTVTYLDADGNTQTADATALTANDTNLGSTASTLGSWYVVNSNLTISSRITVSGTVNLILADGYTLSVSGGINLTIDNTLNIYVQSGGTGALTVSGVDTNYAGIGGMSWQSGGTVTINGGTINVTGGVDGAGIGGGVGGNGGTVTINGGTVTATGGTNAMGIGCGRYSSDNGTLTLGFGVVLQTSDDGETWTTTTDTSTSTRYMKTSAGTSGSSYTITIPSTLTVSNTGWNALEGGLSVDMNLKSTQKLTITASSNNKFNFINSDDNSEKVAYYFLTGGDSTTTFDSADAQVSWDFTASGSKDIGIMVEDYSEKPAGTYKETVTFTASVEEATSTEGTVDLSTLTASYEAKDGDSLTGTLGANVKISIADGATVTLNNVNINGNGTWTDGDYAGITCEGDATIILSGTNTVKGFKDDYPGIYVDTDKTLTIKGDGSLNASSSGWGAGIGGGSMTDCGNIVIESGNITAMGGYRSAGIGSGSSYSCGIITISGGTINATGGSYAAGIGGGSNASCGNITISGGTIDATGGSAAAGIGSGQSDDEQYASCGDITITDGVTRVSATKGDAPGIIDSIGKGKGDGASCGTVTIGGTVYYDGNNYQNDGDNYLTKDTLTYQPSN